MVLAVSWAGVARADRDQGSATAPAAVMVDMAVDVVGAAPEASPASDGTLVPAPPVTRQVIVVRRSRAS